MSNSAEKSDKKSVDFYLLQGDNTLTRIYQNFSLVKKDYNNTTLRATALKHLKKI